MSSHSSVDRVRAQCSGGHGFNFLSGTQVWERERVRDMSDPGPSENQATRSCHC